MQPQNVSQETSSSIKGRIFKNLKYIPGMAFHRYALTDDALVLSFPRMPEVKEQIKNINNKKMLSKMYVQQSFYQAKVYKRAAILVLSANCFSLFPKKIFTTINKHHKEKIKYK